MVNCDDHIALAGERPGNGAVHKPRAPESGREEDGGITGYLVVLGPVLGRGELVILDGKAREEVFVQRGQRLGHLPVQGGGGGRHVGDHPDGRLGGEARLEG